MSVTTIPSFARVEIRIAGVRDLLTAGEELRKLAAALEKLGRSLKPDNEATILAHHEIRAVSKKLRGVE